MFEHLLLLGTQSVLNSAGHVETGTVMLQEAGSAFTWIFVLRYAASEAPDNNSPHWLYRYMIWSPEIGLSWCPSDTVWMDSAHSMPSSSWATHPDDCTALYKYLPQCLMRQMHSSTINRFQIHMPHGIWCIIFYSFDAPTFIWSITKSIFNTYVKVNLWHTCISVTC
jgi:hypothetical protein